MSRIFARDLAAMASRQPGFRWSDLATGQVLIQLAGSRACHYSEAGWCMSFSKIHLSSPCPPLVFLTA